MGEQQMYEAKTTSNERSATPSSFCASATRNSAREPIFRPFFFAISIATSLISQATTVAPRFSHENACVASAAQQMSRSLLPLTSPAKSTIHSSSAVPPLRKNSKKSGRSFRLNSM